MTIRPAAAITALAILLAQAAPAAEGVRVVDGDTIDVTMPPPRGQATEIRRIRLMGIDAPESHRPRCDSERRRAIAAGEDLRAAVAAAGHVRLDLRGLGKWRRRLGWLTLDGLDTATGMIAMGHARPNHGQRRRGWCGL